jgi:hypothetical protein
MRIFLTAFLLFLSIFSFSQDTDTTCSYYRKKGIIYYNEAVAVITSISPDDPIELVFRSQDDAQKKFSLAFPFLLKADSLCGPDTGLMEALTGTCYALNKKREYAFHKNRMDSLKSLYRSRGLAETWLRLMFSGNHLDSLMMISGPPFVWDNEDVVSTKEHLLEMYKDVFEKKGRNRTCTIQRVACGYPRSVPGDFGKLIGIIFTMGGEGAVSREITVFIRVGSKPEVAGFKD